MFANRKLIALVPSIVGAAFSFALSAVAAETPVDFGTQVRPILADKCVRCHGPDESARQADLRLDQEAGIRLAFSGGDFSKSEAWGRLNSDDEDKQMPPPDSGKPLSAKDRALLKRWMDSGAKWAPHWAFVAPQVTKVNVGNRELGSVFHNEIDEFVAERLNREGLAFSPEANRATLIRRLSFDLTGLPPSPAQVAEFVADNSPQAYDHLVDRLLASPHYGENMAMDWLDGARFADTNGYQGDFERSMWPWRDWVIEAFNSNMPFDQFAIEQLAGDLLPNPSDSQKIATGFNRNHRTVTECGSIEEEWRVENVVDRVETTAGVFMGLTFGCARCHDHRYDPITQRDFYEFYAFFNSVAEKGVYPEQPGNQPPLMEVPSEQDRHRLAEINRSIRAAEETLKQTSPDPKVEIEHWLQRAENLSKAPPHESLPPTIRIKDQSDVAKNLPTDKIPSEQSNHRAPKLVEGLLGPAFEFTGAESLALTFQPDQRSPFALSVWINPPVMNENEVAAIVSNLDEGEYRGCDVLLEEAGRLSVQLINSWPVDALKVITKRPLPHDVWSHIVVTWDGSSKAKDALIFVNGESWPVDVKADTLLGPIKTNQPLRIGGRASARFFQGELADLMIFDRALSGSEAEALCRTALREALEQIDRTNSDQQVRLEAIAALLPGSKRSEQTRKLENLKLQREAIVKSIPTVMIMQDLPSPRKTYLLKRGRYNLPDESEELHPNVPAFLPPLPKGAPRDRLTLARWIASPENPLTARVIVNRIWQRHFGAGLVSTSENFGMQAEPPSHPKLLDWLAVSLLRSGWDLKQLHRTIVASATYRQSSSAASELFERDPDNRWLARGARFRLPAEMIRDNALAVSGLLTARIGGPSVLPYQPSGLWGDLAGGYQPQYVQSQGANLYRRSLYTYRKRTISHPTLNTFDAPSWEVCALKRPSTNTPLQALALLNDVTYTEAARKFAERIMVEGGPTSDDRIRYAFRLATARGPTDAELKTLAGGFTHYLAEFRRSPESAEKFLQIGDSPVSVEHDRVELAALGMLASVLLNLDETIVKE